MPTATTLPLIVLLMLLWHYTKGQILAMVLFTSIFEAASAINFGTFGVAPWLFVLAIGLFFKMLKGVRPQRLTVGINQASLHLLIIFLAYAMWTGLVYPVLFHGAPVMHDAASVPLSWSFSNLAQLCYLLAAATLYVLTITSSREELKQAVGWYVRGCFVAACFAMYQLANAVIHVPYPKAILYSNPSHVIYHAYLINGMWRLNSTFPEASEMATFMTVGIGLLGWNIMTRPLSLRPVLYFGLMLVSLLLTVSSLGYACLIFMMALGGLLYGRHIFRGGGISAGKLVAGLSILLVITGTLTLTDANKVIAKVITSTLLEKKDSQSYRERTETHTAALETLSQTYYMGAGWGSVRASGLMYILLGNVGILGVLLLAAFYVSLFWPLWSERWRHPWRQAHDLFEQSLFGTTIMLFGLMVAGAEPVQPILWVLFGVATAARPTPQTVQIETLAAA